MKKLLVLLLLIISWLGCRKCETCNKGMVYKDGDCICETGVFFEGDCVDIKYLNDNRCFLHDTSNVCDGFEILNEIIMIKVPGFFWPGQDVELDYVFYSSNEFSLFYLDRESDDSMSWSPTGFGGWRGILYWDYFRNPIVKVIDGEDYYLRCHLKKVTDTEYKVYFFWSTRERVIKGECVRRFYHP